MATATNVSPIQHAHALIKSGDLDSAGEELKKIIGDEPESFEGHQLLAQVHLGNKQYRAAEHHYGICTNLKKGHAISWWNLGIAFFEQKKYDAALISFKQGLDFDDSLINSHSLTKIGTVHHQLENFRQAEKIFLKAISLNKKDTKAWMSYAITLHETGRHQKSLAAVEQARAINFRRDHQLLRCYGLIALGRDAEGWQNYDGRMKVKAFGSSKFKGDAWQGDHGDGRSLCLHREQGAGDVLQFIRFAPLCLTERGFDKVYVKVARNVARLLRGQDWPLKVVGKDPSADVNLHLGSLPALFNVGRRPIPFADERYLRADPKLALEWRKFLDETMPPGPRIGLVWAGNPKFNQDSRRSPRLPPLLPLLAAFPKVPFISIQKGDGEKDLEAIERPENLHHFPDRIKDFADTAALIDGLDAIVSSCTSVVHLAGAMGKTVFLVIPPHILDWRWPSHVDNSAWYKDVRVFRQAKPGDWPSAVSAATAELDGYLKGGGG